ncbi:MAG TPA: cytochrome P450 [Caldimonas sp.]|jgi:fatty-acid peroxygenase|nr:cytochrome P450 [Caldimonas sp.]HEX2542467.1 cytochrome P450 [Caldimonas sp.]
MSLSGGVRPIPRLDSWDSSLALLADPYRFIDRHCTELGTDVFETRLMLQRTLCMRGVRAAELFYDTARFQRAGAAPEPLRATLFGKGAVQGLDGEAHRRRKSLFTGTLGADAVGRLGERVRREWEAALPGWERAGSISLYRAVQPVLTQAVCDWAGVPLAAESLPRRTAQLTALFDFAASGARRHLRARVARMQAEAWIAGLVRDARAHRGVFTPGSAADRVAAHRDADGELLAPRVAAVELINILRPTVAVSVYIVFVAHALHAHPAWRAILAQPGTSAEALAFTQEVRRHYPFFPATVAKVRHAFDWNGMHFPKGRRTMLDLHGTNHDPLAWPDPHTFSPRRWSGRAPGRFDFVPQGGGDAATHHRCPGEDVATRLMLLALQMLLTRMEYRVAARSSEIDMRRLPALPRDGFVIENVRRAPSSRY